MSESSEKKRFGRLLLILAGAGVALGVLSALIVGFVVNHRINTSTYSVTAQNGYSGNSEGEILPALQLQYDASAIAEKVADNVITLIAYEYDGSYGFGSGVYYKEDDEAIYILTNGHVVDGAAAVTAYFTGAVQPEVEVLGYSMQADAALVKLYKGSVPDSILESIVLAEIGDSSKLRPGDFVVTLGTPSELTYRNTITAGVISGLNRQVTISGYDRVYMQMDAIINPGNSGGALFDEDGKLVGITAAKIISDDVEGVCFALPINEFLAVVDPYLPN